MDSRFPNFLRFQIDLDIFNSKSSIAVATSAWHLTRAMREFEKHFDKTIPVPTDFFGKQKSKGVSGLIPQATSLLMGTYLIHEMIGRVWYKLKTIFSNKIIHNR